MRFECRYSILLLLSSNHNHISLYITQSDAPTGKAILTEDTLAIGSIRRGDVADLVVKALSSKNTEKKILSAVDHTLESTANPEGRTAEAFALN